MVIESGPFEAIDRKRQQSPFEGNTRRRRRICFKSRSICCKIGPNHARNKKVKRPITKQLEVDKVDFTLCILTEIEQFSIPVAAEFGYRRVRADVLQPGVQDAAAEASGALQVQVPLVLLRRVRGVLQGGRGLHLQLTRRQHRGFPPQCPRIHHRIPGFPGFPGASARNMSQISTIDT